MKAKSYTPHPGSLTLEKAFLNHYILRVNMPYQLHIDVTSRRIDILFSGRISGKDVNEALTNLFEDPNWSREYHHIWDGSGVVAVDFGYSEFKYMKQLIERVRFPAGTGQGCMAVVVPNRVGYVLARATHAAFPECKPFGVFKKRSAAEEWINFYDTSVSNIMSTAQNVFWRNV